MLKNTKLSLLDNAMIEKRVFDEDRDAHRVVIVSGELPEIKFSDPAPPAAGPGFPGAGKPPPGPPAAEAPPPPPELVIAVGIGAGPVLPPGFP